MFSLGSKVAKQVAEVMRNLAFPFQTPPIELLGCTDFYRAKDQVGNLTLHLAARGGHLEVASRLVEAMAPVSRSHFFCCFGSLGALNLTRSLPSGFAC